ncbi:MAG TPA: GNAT family protein [Acetobacteraceae bacterium]|nr:GNAT family protein [Acetobacteraceae bacterium]
MTQRTNEYGLPVGDPVPGWTARPRPGPEPMVGRYCTLEKLDAAKHADGLFEAYMEAPDGRDWTYLFVDRPATREAYREYAEKNAASPDPYHYAIRDNATGLLIGTSSLMRIDPAMGVIEVGNITYSPRIQKRPAGTEAQYLQMRRAFDELGYRRYEWKCDSLNAPSRAAATRYGFVFEGIFRQAVIYKGRNRDTAWFSVIDREWPALKSAFERWLDPTNFDADGRQRARLRDLRQ